MLLMSRWMIAEASTSTSSPAMHDWISRAMLREEVPVGWMSLEEKGAVVRALEAAARSGDLVFRAAVSDLGRICRRENSIDSLLAFGGV